MNERRYAKKLDDIFADNRINPVQLAHLTARMMNDQTNTNLTQWYTWHIDLTFQQENPDQSMFDFDLA